MSMSHGKRAGATGDGAPDRRHGATVDADRRPPTADPESVTWNTEWERSQ